MWNLFSVNTVVLSIGGYPLSLIEFSGTVLYFASVFLITRKNIITWPVGIASVILYAILFYQIQLYADMMEQGYYLVISIIGWVVWKKRKDQSGRIGSSWSGLKGIVTSLSITLLGSAVLTFIISHFHIWFPGVFFEPASFPALDAITTVMSFIAMYLITRRKNEGWIYWIVVDIIGIGLYWVKDVRFIAVQYVLLLGMAVYGLLFWVQKGKQKYGV